MRQHVLFARLHFALLVAALCSCTACKSAADCAYNGECTGGSCVCIPAFKGDACDVFNFAPLDLSQGTGLRSIKNGEQVSSWGGSVLLADDGKYHMVSGPHIYNSCTNMARYSTSGLPR